MSEIINLNSKRPPVVYTVTIVHHYDDTLEFRIENVADDERSREAVMSAFRRISGADEEIEKLQSDLRNAIFSDIAYTKEIERQDVLLREENARLLAANKDLQLHFDVVIEDLKEAEEEVARLREALAPFVDASHFIVRVETGTTKEDNLVELAVKEGHIIAARAALREGEKNG